MGASKRKFDEWEALRTAIICNAFEVRHAHRMGDYQQVGALADLFKALDDYEAFFVSTLPKPMSDWGES